MRHRDHDFWGGHRDHDLLGGGGIERIHFTSRSTPLALFMAYMQPDHKNEKHVSFITEKPAEKSFYYLLFSFINS